MLHMRKERTWALTTICRLSNGDGPGHIDRTTPVMTTNPDELVKVAVFLRSSPKVRTQEFVMAERRVDVFKGIISFLQDNGSS